MTKKRMSGTAMILFLLLVFMIAGCAHAPFSLLTSNRKILFLCPEIDSSVASLIAREELCDVFGVAVMRAQYDFAGHDRFREFKLLYARQDAEANLSFEQYLQERETLLEIVARSERVVGIVFGIVSESENQNAVRLKVLAYYRNPNTSHEFFEWDVWHDPDLLRDEAFWIGKINESLSKYME